MFFPDHRNLYINVSIVLTVMMLCYVFHVRPFEESSMNRQEIVNEYIVLNASYVLFMYTEFVWDAETRYLVGWGHTGILGSSLVFNMSFMGVLSMRMCKLRIKRRKNLATARKAHKERLQAKLDVAIKKQEVLDAEA